jgi:membrane associated rhomboid family serine protease
MTWEVGVLLAASALALQLVSLTMRRELREELPYAALLAGDLALLWFAHSTHRDGALVGWLGCALAAVMVLGPRFVDGMERRAWARDDLAAALRAAKLRELLVPGLGATRRRRQLANLVEARAGGAAQVLRRLDAELATARGEAEVTTILLERTTVLFMAQRYRECIEAASRLPSSWPEQHPVLGVYLVRAHAELGELDEASLVLRAVERGAAGRDPTMLGLLTQARLTLLAFAGRQADVDRLLAGEARQLVSARARQFLHDTARDHAATVVPSDLAAILDEVAVRAAESSRPLVRPRGRAPVTLVLVAANVAAALVVGHFFGEPPGGTLIRDGALFRPAVEAGEWWRVFTAMFLHGGPWHLGLNMYALFMLGRFCEEVFGPLRYFVTYVAGGLVGALGSTFNTRQAGLSVGASGAIMGLLGALIVVLILRRGTWPEAWRRALLWNLVLLGALQIYIGFQLPMIDNAAHVGGMLGGGAMALLVAPGGLIGRSTMARALVAALALAGLGGFAWAGVEVARTPLAATWDKLPKKSVTVDGRSFAVPTYWEHDAEHDVWMDPYLGVQLGKRATPDSTPVPDDPELKRLMDRIAKSPPTP